MRFTKLPRRPVIGVCTSLTLLKVAAARCAETSSSCTLPCITGFFVQGAGFARTEAMTSTAGLRDSIAYGIVTLATASVYTFSWVSRPKPHEASMLVYSVNR